MTQSKGAPSHPSFEACPLKIGGEWSVLVKWPDGRRERIGGFKSGAQAFWWIENESQSWLAQRFQLQDMEPDT